MAVAVQNNRIYQKKRTKAFIKYVFIFSILSLCFSALNTILVKGSIYYPFHSQALKVNSPNWWPYISLLASPENFVNLFFLVGNLPNSHYPSSLRPAYTLRQFLSPQLNAFLLRRSCKQLRFHCDFSAICQII